MKINILLVALVILLFSCSSNQNSYLDAHLFSVNDFKTSEQLTGKILELNDLVMRPTDILVCDSLLITIEYGGDKLFHIYNLKEQKQVNQCIVMGQGPNDMLQPEFMHRNGNFLKIIDLASSTVYEYEIKDFITNPEPKPIHRIKLEEQIFLTAQQAADNIIGYSYGTENRVYKFDLTGKKTDALVNYPVSSIEYSDMEKMDAFYMKFITNGSDKIALCHYMTDLIEIYDTNGVLQKRMHGPEQFLAHFKQIQDGPMGASPVKGMNRDAFMCPRNAGNEFFVLYNGGYIDDPGHTTSCNRLFSFSWDGTPQKNYNLDDPIFSFTIDTQNKKIYGISETPEFHIVEYSYN